MKRFVVVLVFLASAVAFTPTANANAENMTATFSSGSLMIGERFVAEFRISDPDAFTTITALTIAFGGVTLILGESSVIAPCGDLLNVGGLSATRSSGWVAPASPGTYTATITVEAAQSVCGVLISEPFVYTQETSVVVA